MGLLEKVFMTKENSGDAGEGPRRPDPPPEAKRALAEAEERRRLAKLAEDASAPKPKEVNGPQGARNPPATAIGRARASPRIFRELSNFAVLSQRR